MALRARGSGRKSRSSGRARSAAGGLRAGACVCARNLGSPSSRAQPVPPVRQQAPGSTAARARRGGRPRPPACAGAELARGPAPGKKHKCADCGKSFNHNAHLQVHGASTRARPYACRSAARPSARTAKLVQHGAHPHTGTSLQIAECGSAHTARTSRCWRIHTGEKPYACQDCGRAFSRTRRWAARARTPAKPFACSVCGKAFSRTTCLFLHLRAAHGRAALRVQPLREGLPAGSSLAQHQRRRGRRALRLPPGRLLALAPAGRPEPGRGPADRRPFRCGRVRQGFAQSCLIRHPDHAHPRAARGRGRRRPQARSRGPPRGARARAPGGEPWAGRSGAARRPRAQRC